MATSVVIPNGYGLATLKWTFIPAGKVISVTVGYQDAAATDTPTSSANGYRNAMTTTGAPAAAASMTTQWRFEGVTVLQRLSSGLLQTGQNLTSVTGTATGGTDTNPIFTTLVVSKVTAYAGRAFRGRMYAPYSTGPESEVDFNGTIAPAAVTAWQTRWNVFASSASISPVPMALLHTAPTIGPPIPPTLITALLVRPVVGIQRRRRAKGA